MKLRPLIIGADEKTALSNLKKHAENNPFSLDDVMDMYNRTVPAPGHRAGFKIILPIDYSVVFTIEMQKNGWARHLSVTVLPEIKNQYPNPVAVLEICTYLGFLSTEWGNGLIVVQQDDHIINVVEYI